MTVRDARRTVNGHSDVRKGGWYLRGVLVSLTNPKLMLFFLAVLPKFMGSAENYALQMAMLGAVDVLMEMALYGGIGLSAGVFHARLTGTRNAAAALNYIASAVYAVLAATVVAGIVTG